MTRQVAELENVADLTAAISKQASNLYSALNVITSNALGVL